VLKNGLNLLGVEVLENMWTLSLKLNVSGVCCLWSVAVILVFVSLWFYIIGISITANLWSKSKQN